MHSISLRAQTQEMAPARSTSNQVNHAHLSQNTLAPTHLRPLFWRYHSQRPLILSIYHHFTPTAVSMDNLELPTLTIFRTVRPGPISARRVFNRMAGPNTHAQLHSIINSIKHFTVLAQTDKVSHVRTQYLYTFTDNTFKQSISLITI